MPGFDDLGKISPERGGCHICGEPVGGSVTLLVRERTPGQTGYGPQRGSKGVSFCEAHAVEVFVDLRTRLLEHAARKAAA